MYGTLIFIDKRSGRTKSIRYHDTVPAEWLGHLFMIDPVTLSMAVPVRNLHKRLAFLR
jgi:hypothetical protein